MIDLSGRVALVTGSSRGIGRACAMRLAQAGADIITNYVTSRSAAEAVAEQAVAMGRRAWIVKADMSEEDDIESMMDFVAQRIGQLDIVVSNAASGGFRPLLQANLKHFQATMNLNVMALIHLVRTAMPLLQRSEGRAKVIALSSHGSQIALPMYGLVGTSKAAVESLARHLALEVGHRGVNVNVVKSGLVETDSTRRFPDAERMFAQRHGKMMTGDRMLTSDDVADAVAFLASPLSDMVQGEVLTVDGGAAVHV